MPELPNQAYKANGRDQNPADASGCEHRHSQVPRSPRDPTETFGLRREAKSGMIDPNTGVVSQFALPGTYAIGIKTGPDGNV